MIRTCRELGVRTVAVYSDADAGAMHVQMADEAYRIGGSAASDSYLRGDTILEVAKKSGAQAVHPGYGFLSENAAFATQCEAAGVRFIGPPVRAITAMGSKSQSKLIMESSGVPCVPGYHGEAQDNETLRAEAERVGFPLMIKAVLGGGGKGMRMVRSMREFDEKLQGCQRESLASFGDSRVLLERYLTSPRHVEIQVFADTHGNCVYLFERDCSLQRRHQKVIEEAPAPAMSSELRKQMGEAAVAAANAVGYVGAGTVEFMLDTDESFYFLEMNTRLQVEHPVTELITGLDLVSWQLHVAAGGALPKAQSDLTLNGHAFEARIYAENPENGFLPASGLLAHMQPPTEVQGRVRVDTGVRTGDHVSVFYDPMIAKLIVWGEDRHKALKALAHALESFQIGGVPTNIPFCHRLATHPTFISAGDVRGENAADFDIHFIDKNLPSLMPPAGATVAGRDVALVALAIVLRELPPVDAGPGVSLWEGGGGAAGWRTNHSLRRVLELHRASGTDGESESLEVIVTYHGGGAFTVEVEGEVFAFSGAALGGDSDASSRSLKLTLKSGPIDAAAEQRLQADVAFNGEEVCMWVNGEHSDVPIVLQAPQGSDSAVDGGAGGGGSIVAPMPGKIVRVLVSEGDTVEDDQPLVVMEAMKMEHTLRASGAGVVGEVMCAPGELVGDSKVLVKVTAAA